MKYLKISLAALISALSLISFSGCSNYSDTELSNEMTFDLDKISEISITYDDENITFYDSENDKLIIKEYMSKNKKSYHAKVQEKDNYIHISEGGKPALKSNFYRYIEVYLPKSYTKALTVGTTNGEINLSNIDISLEILNANTTSGIIQINNAAASLINLSTTSGTIDCARLEGKVNYTSTSGSVNIKSAYGSGQYRSDNSGEMDIIYSSVDGDISLYNKNDDVNLTVPHDITFDIQAKSKNGTISAPQSDTASAFKITAESVNGNINIKND